MDVISKIENRGTNGELPEIACGSKHKHLVFVELHLKLVHCIEAIGMFEHRADTSKPLVEPSLALNALIAPVGSHTTLGNLVHALCTYLHLYPLLFRTKHGYMQRLVAV